MTAREWILDTVRCWLTVPGDVVEFTDLVKAAQRAGYAYAVTVIECMLDDGTLRTGKSVCHIEVA